MPDYNPAEEAHLVQYNKASNKVLVDVTRYAIDSDPDKYIEICEDNLFKPEVVAYMRLLIDQMLQKTKKVEYGSKKDRTRDGDRASEDGKGKGGEAHYGVRQSSAQSRYPIYQTDATNKAYVNLTIRDNNTSMRAYMDMRARDGETTMRTHYTAYFDNANAEMGKIVEIINSVHYAVERDINGIIANIIPSVVKTMILELVRENGMLIVDLKTRFDSFTPQVVNIQKEILTKITNSIKIAIEESTKESNIIIGDLKA
ncbi:hypothetical protein FQA39_LY17649 [Lamprigera yunnana]|nr:hypothetical protein FQA39_LY17649 [Lamprigera yunnana]